MTRVFLCSALVALLMCTSSVSALKILGITSVPSPSHHIWFTTLMNGLARKGHQIYALSTEPTKFDVDKVMENQTTSFVFEGILEAAQKGDEYNPLDMAQMNTIEMGWLMCLAPSEFCREQIATQGAKQVLELVRNTKIDIIVQDLTFGQCFYAFQEIALGNPLLVGFTPYGMPQWVDDIVGGNDWPAIRQYHIYRHTLPFTLWERILNFIYYQIDDIARQYYYLPMEQKLGEKFIERRMSRSLNEIEKNISVMLLNSYAALEPAIFLPPNAIEVGGLHVKDPKPLPEDIKAFLDGAEHGVVVISMGSNVKFSVLGPERLKAIITALGKLKQRVLWKFDQDHLPDQPKNVMIKKWLPQGDILAHPKVRVLWSHSGLLSTQEAIWRGIPMIGMPFFMDQYPNIDRLVKKGVALRLDFEDLTTERILETFDRILTDTSFYRRMKQLSLEYTDRPMSPLDLAIWHIEYAFRHPHGPLASPGRHMSRMQLNLLDVYAVLGVAVLAILWIFWLLLRALLKLVFGTQRKTKTAQKLKAS